MNKILSLKIGHCDTCQNLFCETPKIRQRWPEKGCPEWMDLESRAIPDEPVCIIEKELI